MKKGVTKILGLAIAMAMTLFLVPGGLKANAASPKSISSATIDNANSNFIFTYDGTVKSPTLVLKDGDYTLVHSADPTTGDYTTSGTKSMVDAGTYTMTVTGHGNYTGSMTVTWAINKAAGSASITGVVSSTVYGAGTSFFTYTGSGYVIYTDAACTTKTSTADGATTDGGVPTDVGTYYVKAISEEDANHTYYESAASSFDIIAASVTAPTANTTTALRTVTYNGSEQSYSASGTGYSISGAGTNADTYPVMATLSDTKNTVWDIGGVAPIQVGNLVINKKDVYVTFTDTGDKTYDGSSKGVSASFSGALSDEVQPVITYDASPVGVGTYTATASLKPADADNYNISGTNTASFAIVPAVVTVPTADSTVFTFNEQTQTYGSAWTISGYSVTGNTESHAGTYYVTCSLSDSTNYVWSTGDTANKTYTFVINPLDISRAGTLGIGNCIYDGTEQSPAIYLKSNDIIPLGAFSVYGDTSASQIGTYVIHVAANTSDYIGQTILTWKVLPKPVVTPAVNNNSNSGSSSTATATETTVTTTTAPATYTVVKGDTLNKIAKRNGLTLKQLLALNPQIKNANLIHVGATINLGTTTVTTTTTESAATATTAATATGTYTVVKGDYMSKIAKAHNMTLAELVALNPQIKNINLIHAGQVINVSK